MVPGTLEFIINAIVGYQRVCGAEDSGRLVLFGAAGIGVSRLAANQSKGMLVCLLVGKRQASANTALVGALHCAGGKA